MFVPAWRSAKSERPPLALAERVNETDATL
jgi:hypothetical protein